MSSGDEGWTGQQRDGSSVPVQWSPSSHEISLVSEDYFPIYFVAPGMAACTIHGIQYKQMIVINK